jgi:hypothetical protein
VTEFRGEAPIEFEAISRKRNGAKTEGAGRAPPVFGASRFEIQQPIVSPQRGERAALPRSFST